MVKVVIENNICSRIDGKLDAHVKHELDRTLSYYEDGYQFSPRFKRKVWDGRVKLFNKAMQVFQTGCFFIVSQILQKHQVEFRIEDNRKRVLLGKCLPVHGKEIRDYQEEAIKALLGKARGILLAATGAGKTFIIANVVARLNLPTVIYTHTCDLLHQMKDEIEGMLKIECGQLGDGVVNVRQINVATMQTVSRALLGKYEKEDEEDVADDFETDIEPYKDRIVKMIRECNVVIIDETHHASATSIQSIMSASENAYYRYGVTATLREKGDDLLIHSVLGRVVYTVRASELIKKKWLVQPTIFFYEVENDLKAQQGSYRQVYKNCIVENAVRNKLIIDSALKFFRGGKKILILVRQIDHGNVLMRQLEGDMQIRFLQSKVDSDVRKEVLRAFKGGELDCLIATSLAWEESILIKRKGLVRHIQIGELIDHYLQDEGVKNVEGIEVLTIDKERKTVWKEMKAVVKHKRQNEILQVTTDRGQEVRVTENHSLIGENEEKVEPKVGNKVLLGGRFDLPQNLEEINLIQSFAEKLTPKEKIRVRVELFGENLCQANQYKMKSDWIYLSGRKNEIDPSTQMAVRKRLKQYTWNIEEYAVFLEWFWTNVEYKRGRNKTSQYSCSIEQAAKCKVDIEKFCSARIYYHRSRTVVFLPLKMKITPELVRLIGYYTSEGSKGEYGERTGWKITLAASDYTEQQVKEKYQGDSKYDQMMRWKAEIRIDMKRCFNSILNVGVNEEKKRICIDNKLAYLLFTHVLECKELAENKDIPAIIFNLPNELKWEFINAYLRGDGHYEEKGDRFTFASVSYKLISGLSLLLRALNCVSFYIYRRNKEDNETLRSKFDCYQLHCNDANFQGPFPELIKGIKNKENIEVITIQESRSFSSRCPDYVYDICVPGVERFICGSGLCASNTLADEGLDLPVLDAVILAGSGKSKIKAFQRIGRAIRKFPGKDKAYIVDFMDKAHYLEKHSEERLKIYQTEEEFIIKIQKKS